MHTHAHLCVIERRDTQARLGEVNICGLGEHYYLAPRFIFVGREQRDALYTRGYTRFYLSSLSLGRCGHKHCPLQEVGVTLLDKKRHVRVRA